MLPGFSRLHAYAITTQATNKFLWQDFHLQVTEQLSVHSERNILVGYAEPVKLAYWLIMPLITRRPLIRCGFS